MRMVVVAAVAVGFSIITPASAQTCGPPCQRCVKELGVPVDAKGIPMPKSMGRGFYQCVERERQKEMTQSGSQGTQQRRR